MLIDCDAGPVVPREGWTVEEHITGGRLAWGTDPVGLYSSSCQEGSMPIVAHRFRAKVIREGVPVLNTNVLDCLLANPDLPIPEEWKRTRRGDPTFIIFLGTLFRSRDRNGYVRLCYWQDGRLEEGLLWNHGNCGDSYKAAVRAS